MHCESQKATRLEHKNWISWYVFPFVQTIRSSFHFFLFPTITPYIQLHGSGTTMSILLAFKERVDNNGIGGIKRILLDTFKGCVYEDSTRDSGLGWIPLRLPRAIQIV